MSNRNLQISVRFFLFLIINLIVLGNAAAQTPREVMGIDKSLLAFDKVQVGGSLDLTFKISNEGDADLAIDSMKTSNAAYRISPSSFILSSGSSQTVKVTFTPVQYGSLPDTLKIYAKDTTAVIRITGIGVRTSGAYLSIWQKKMSFGAQKTGNAVTKKIMISNFGVVDMNMKPFSYSGNTENAFSAVMKIVKIPSCDSAECEVTFTPQSEKDYSSYLNLNSDAVNTPAGSPVQLQLEGKGISGTAGPSASISRNTINFGEVLFQQKTSQDLIISNTGMADLIVTSITADNSSFVSGIQNFTIAPGSSKTVSVAFEPQAEGPYDNTLTIYHNAPGSPVRVTLTGACVKYKSQVSVNIESVFENITDIRNYRIIGLPGKIDLPLSQVLKGRSEYDWNAVWDNGQASGYKIKYDGTSKFNFRPGNAFWILSRDPLKVSVTAESVPLNSSRIYSIPLHSGWNLISNPFDIIISWDKIRQANNLPSNTVIYSWNGAYDQSSLFAPYQGYYFYNTLQLDSLKIPFTLQTSAAPAQSIRKQRNSSLLKITLLGEGRELSAVSIGLDTNASSDFDTLDFFMPPGDFESAGIRIYNGSIKPGYKYLSCDMRSDKGCGEIFDLKLKNELNKNLTLKTDGAESFNGYEVYLFEKVTGSLTDLRSETSINISSFHKQREYSVAVGNSEFINTLKRSMVPSAFKVNQNYPNPFNPSTSIIYSIPSSSRIEICIYNMLGERIERLKNKFENAGTYEVNWDASNFAAGVYFLAFTASPVDGSKTYSTVRKMILLK